MQVIQESKPQVRAAERYLHALRMAYPEVMASIRTKQVAQEMLLVKEAYVHELKASGKHVPQFCLYLLPDMFTSLLSVCASMTELAPLKKPA